MTPILAAAREDAGGRQRQLVRGYLHKTSNSLCGIKGYASLIAAAGDDRPATVWARKILDEVEQLELIYRSVQDIAFPKREGLGGGDLASAVAAAVHAVRRRHPRLRVRLRLRAAGGLLLPARDLQLALEEILANSAEAYPAGADAPVTVTTVPGREGRVAVAIADRGGGMGPELLAEAAAPFVTTKPGRLGIGLARVDTLLEMHGLAWALDSVRGEGTQVVLEVARDAATAAAAAQERTER